MFSVVATVLSTLLMMQTVPASAVPSFIINLDLPPESRWSEVAMHYKDYMIKAGMGMDLKSDNNPWRSVKFDPEYEAELQGMVTVIGDPRVTLQSLRMQNLGYELGTTSHACSDVLWARTNGSVLHGRNLDLKNGIADHLPDTVFDVTMVKGGKPLFKQTQFSPGFVGVHTAMRFGGWSVAQNTRMTNEARGNLNASKYGGEVGFLAVRKIIETTPDFKTAVERIYSAKFMAPQYFIMAGSGAFEGAVVTVDRLGRHKGLPDTPPIQYVSNSSKDSWHLVQTNDDLLKKALDKRRPTANHELKQMTQQIISEPHLLQFMHTEPLFVPRRTIFTTAMVPSSGYYTTVLPTDPPAIAKEVVPMTLAIEGMKTISEGGGNEVLLEMNRTTRDVKPQVPVPEKVKLYIARMPHTHKRLSLRGKARGSQVEDVGDISSLMQLAIHRQET
jgi:hypothetical protein